MEVEDLIQHLNERAVGSSAETKMIVYLRANIDDVNVERLEKLAKEFFENEGFDVIEIDVRNR